MNPLYGERGLQHMEGGRSAAETIALLVAADDGREHRQAHAVDAAGRTAAHTGTACVEWCGQRAADGVSVAGNMLAGARVVESTLQRFLALDGTPLGLRLLRALKAGEDAGGDKRGKQSAALLVVRDQRYSALDIRADDHPEPIDELFRLYEVAHQRYLPFSQAFATEANPAGITDRAQIDEAIARWLDARAGEGGPGRI
jgi:uncharacterized Ntn-hydrolase superfamily protein